MYSQVALHSKIRAVLVFALIAAFLPAPYTGLMRIAAQGQGRGPDRQGQPKRGKPEGVFPDLEQVQQELNFQREPAPPIHSTTRSPKNPLNPWNGRRVGDPGTRGELGQAINRPRRAHASRRDAAPPPVLDDQFIANFFNWAVLRAPNGNEPTYWKDQFRVAYAREQTSLKLAAVELGKTLFESAEYAARGRDNHWYVYDLYKAYLMRDPDSSGWAFWETQVEPNGRENVRRAFEESPEFAGIIASIVPNGLATDNAASLISARVDPKNQPGNGMLARDATWSVSLLSLPGRAGLDLGLALSYSSMVWTRNGPYIHFDEDNGFPSPGFRLGFPTVQRKVFDAQTGKNSFLMISATGRRVELRQVGSSNVYESGDSSYLQLTDNSPNLLLRSTDGTQLSFVEINNEYSCTQVKDRNGNYITVNHNGLGRITAITDTLGRVINFNYDGNANLISITQTWDGQTPPHQWVAFSWGNRNMQSSFSSVSVVGPKNGTSLPLVTGVTLNDTSQVTFDYSNSLQVNLIRNEFGAIQRNETTFTYESPTNDVPRLSDSRVSARNWTGINGVPSQVITTYSVAGDGACVMTAADGTIYKEYYGTGWQRGLTTLSEVWSGGVRQKWTTTSWIQDNTSVGYEVNPRVTETNVQDGTSQRRTVIDYGGYAQWGLPYLVKEFASNGTTEIRHTYTDYNLSQAYLDRRIIGLVSEVHLTNISQYLGKITYSYDDPARLQAVPLAATQHDTTYSTSFTARGNVSAVSRWDFTDITNASKKLTTYTNYNTTGWPISTTDPEGHQSSIAYNDAYSDNINRNTFAYPTTVTDAGGFSSYIQYNFDFAATTRTQTPAPAGQSQGAIQTLTYNNLGQLERTTTTNSNAYTRFWYGADFKASYATVNNVADESYSMQTFDGLGRPLGTASNHPGSSGGYKAQINVYDFMGRVKKTSNPAETNSNWAPFGDDSAGWLYTEQTYDWKGRPLIITNPNTTTRELSYSGCGCAGAQVVTLIDEGTIDAGTPKRRKQKIYSDVFGRTVKTEVFVWQSDTVYSTVVNTYNVRDQLEEVREYVGSESSGTYQTTSMTYDGYGRLKSKHVPEQDNGADTVWTYNADDTIQKITDARGAATINTYNSRHLITEVSYTVPPSSQITVPSTITFTYDGAGNRTSMEDALGSIDYTYDSLSRLTSETREFTEMTGSSYALNYSYNLGNVLTSLSIPFRSRQIGYNYDTAGRLTGVTASGFSATHYVWPNQYTQTLTSFASNITYRAWGARKSMTYGNTTSEQTTYNNRLQPATYTLNNMNYQNTNVCCSYPTYSTMTWSYGYYDDGSLEHAWDATNEWFDRAYKYDLSAD
jgi:YD repeat-containing protein